MLQEQANNIYEEALRSIKETGNRQDLYALKVKYLGKNGSLTTLLKQLKDVPVDQKKQVGQDINKVKVAINEALEGRGTELNKIEVQEKLEADRLDMTLPGPEVDTGSLHPITQVTREIIDILKPIGFSVRTGPMIESDEYNFEFLNFPKDHPARDMQDTFYIDESSVLRTHTSPIQVRTMLNENPPIRILAPGVVFRCDHDVSHLPNFNQIEGLYIDKDVSLAHLKGTISYFVKRFFGTKTQVRFRPSYFPFTEPSAEIDCSCPICSGKGCPTCGQSGWIEIGGSGLVHPNVLKSVNIDPETYQGFAFGFGVERMAMIKFGISDIRLFNENHLSFLESFKS